MVFTLFRGVLPWHAKSYPSLLTLPRPMISSLNIRGSYVKKFIGTATLLSVVCLSLMPAAPAYAENRLFHSWSFEASSCGNWTQTRKNQDNQYLEGWVLGFVTGANAYDQNDGKLGVGSGATAMLAWVDQYCAANPLAPVIEASLKLVIELKKRRGIVKR
jgi:hypothetical protein